MIFWRGKASYLYSTEKDIQGMKWKPRECLGLLEDGSDGFGGISGTKGTFKMDF